MQLSLYLYVGAKSASSTEFTIVFQQKCCHFCSFYSHSFIFLCFTWSILVRYHYFSPLQQVFVLMASQHISHHLFRIQQSFCFSRCLEKEPVFYGEFDSNFPMAILLIPLWEKCVISEDMAAVSHWSSFQDKTETREASYVLYNLSIIRV